MPLPILVTLVVTGIAAIVLAVHFTGGSRKALIESLGAAMQRFRDDYPEDTVSGGVITADRETAFLDLGDDAVGIVHTIGDRFLTRRLKRRDVRAARADGPHGIEVSLDDFTWKAGRFDFDETVSRDVALRLFLSPAESSP